MLVCSKLRCVWKSFKWWKIFEKKTKFQSHNVSRVISLPHVLGAVHWEKPIKALAGVGHLVPSWLHHQLAFSNCYKKRKCGSFNDRQNVFVN